MHDRIAQFNALAANVYTRPHDHAFHRLLTFTAEAADCTFGFIFSGIVVSHKTPYLITRRTMLGNGVNDW